MTKPSEYVWALVCGLPEPKRSNRLLLILRAFIDDSHMNQPPLYVLGGWIAPASKWGVFVDAWQAAKLSSPRIDRFKFADALHDPPKGDFHGLSKESVRLKLQQLVSVVAEHELLGICSIVPHDVFQNYFGGLESKELNNPYILSFYGIVSRLLRHFAGRTDIDKIEFVFDYQPDRGRDSMRRVQEGWDAFYATSPPKFKALLNKHPPSFLSDSEFIALEAADLQAGWVRMVNVNAFAGNPPIEPPWGAGLMPKNIRLSWTLGPDQAANLRNELFGPGFTYTFRHDLPSTFGG